MKKYRIKIILLALFLIILFLPQTFVVPVEGAKKGDWNNKSFWHHTWGKSVVHKGVDVFAPVGSPVVAATSGIVVYLGEVKYGGKVVLVLGAKWRLHYYAHLNEINVGCCSLLSAGDRIGTVGKTGNAKKNPPHLHYSILSLVPYPWKIDSSPMGWKKMFYLNPIPYLNSN